MNNLYVGERPYIHQEIQTVQYGAFIGQVNMAHQPPTVSYNFFHLLSFHVMYKMM